MKKGSLKAYYKANNPDDPVFTEKQYQQYEDAMDRALEYGQENNPIYDSPATFFAKVVKPKAKKAPATKKMKVPAGFNKKIPLPPPLTAAPKAVKPKKKATPAQLAALAKGRATRAANLAAKKK